MAERKDKHETALRHLKAMGKQKARDEREQIKKNKARKNGPGADARRPRVEPDAEDWEDDVKGRFGSRRGHADEKPEAETWTGLVIGVRPDRLDIRCGDEDREVMLRRGRSLPFQAAVGDEAVCERVADTEIVVDLGLRRSRLSRPDPHDRRRERVIAANVDLAVVVLAAADPDFRPALIDRYLVALDVGGVVPLICVNKFDLADDETRAEVQGALDVYRAEGVTCLTTSAMTGAGVDALRSELSGRTVVLSGHSGVGKSALLNKLDPDVVRDTGMGRDHDGKGRHTTTRSELRELSCGTRVIDTPGIREFGLWAVDPDLLRTGFPGIGRFAALCRFSDCRHVEEPDCAVREDLADARYQAYRKLLVEAEA